AQAEAQLSGVQARRIAFDEAGRFQRRTSPGALGGGKCTISARAALVLAPSFCSASRIARSNLSMRIARASSHLHGGSDAALGHKTPSLRKPRRQLVAS